MKRLLFAVLVFAVAFVGYVMAQSAPSFTQGLIPTIAQWQSYFAGKVDVTNGTLTNPTITNGINGDISGATSEATGSTIARSLANRAAQQINVKDYGATGDGVTDDSAAIAAAITASNTSLAAGTPRVIYLPAGKYYIKSTPLPTFVRGGALIGDGTHKSYIIVDTTYSGDVFSWSEAWSATDYGGPSVSASNDKAGPQIRDLTIFGNASSANLQNAFTFYDRDDSIVMSNVDIYFMHGRCLGFGFTKNQALAYTRESKFYHVAMTGCGALSGTVTPTGNTTSGNTTVASISSTTGIAVGMSVTGTGIPDGDEVASVGVGSIVLTETPTASNTGTTLTITNNIPAVEINTVGAGDTSNQMTFNGLDIFQSAGSGLVVRNQNSTKAITQLRFYSLRVESGTAGLGDQIQFGDTGAAYTGKVTDVTVLGMTSNSSIAGYSSVALYANTSAEEGYSYNIWGNIPTGAGTGLNVQSGRIIGFHIGDMGTSGTAVVVGPSSQGIGTILVDGFGLESGWTTSIDVTSAAQVSHPFATLLGNTMATVSLNANKLVGGCPADSTATCGNARGTGAVDLQNTRAQASQVASNNLSVIVGGGNNTATGLNSSVLGGTSNVASGTFGVVAGGSVLDSGFYGTNCYGSGDLHGQGDAQACYTVLRGTTSSTATARLTADGGAASASNCVNLPNSSAYTVRHDLIALDRTTVTNNYSWVEPQALATRGATASTTAYAHGTPTTLSNGTVTGLSITESADTTNGCINITFTPPTSNTDIWDVVDRVTFARVQ